MLKHCRFPLLCLLVLAHLPAHSQESGGVILQYHHVDDSTPPVTSISVEQLQQHMDFLAENNFQVWPLERLTAALRDRTEIPDKVVSITFDDAYLSVYDNALPLLQKHKFPFTIFVATKLIGIGNYLSWDQLREMKSLGITIANHTHSHTHLLRQIDNESEAEWLARIRREIEQAQELLQSNLGDVPKLLAYPYGEYDKQVLELVKTLGYVGLGQQSGAAGYSSSLLILPRFPLSGNYSNFKTFKTKMMTLPMPISSTSILDPVLELTDVLPELTLNFTEDGYRFHQLACYGPGGVTKLEEQNPKTFVVANKGPLPVGRSRYNCTMPDKEGNRFYWYSQLWIRKRSDGSWYEE